MRPQFEGINSPDVHLTASYICTKSNFWINLLRSLYSVYFWYFRPVRGRINDPSFINKMKSSVSKIVTMDIKSYSSQFLWSFIYTLVSFFLISLWDYYYGLWVVIISVLSSGKKRDSILRITNRNSRRVCWSLSKRRSGVRNERHGGWSRGVWNGIDFLSVLLKIGFKFLS